jgi:histidine triad (HIT) family protein
VRHRRVRDRAGRVADGRVRLPHPQQRAGRSLSARADKPCLFCAIAAGTQPAAIVVDEPEVVAFLDHRPVFKGHTLVVPREHVVTLADLPARLFEPVFGTAQRLSAAVVDGLGADGSWVSLNNVVSQSVAHLHVHVVPRRRKDGLRGFYWPRTKYDSDAEMAETAAQVRRALAEIAAPG